VIRWPITGLTHKPRQPASNFASCPGPESPDPDQTSWRSDAGEQRAIVAITESSFVFGLQPARRRAGPGNALSVIDHGHTRAGNGNNICKSLFGRRYRAIELSRLYFCIFARNQDRSSLQLQRSRPPVELHSVHYRVVRQPAFGQWSRKEIQILFEGPRSRRMH
jgi:hypothetical protein